MVQSTERPRIPPVLLFAIATAFGLSSSLQAYRLERIAADHAGQNMIAHLLILNLVYWYIPALLAPVILAFGWHFRFGQQRWYARAPIHVVAAFAYSLVHTAVMLATRALLMPNSGRPESIPDFWTYAQKEYLTQLDWLLMTYLFLVGLAHALQYRRESERRALDAAHLETRLAEAQLQALQRQLHPHFLFNTLNTISGLIRTDSNAADLMIDRLGDLLRMTLHRSVQEVPLKEELDVVQKYVEIEQVRFGSRLRVSMHVQPETLDAHVPNLLLQPLVENAIRHGIAPNARPGWIAVHADRVGDRLILQIRDSGDGLPPERLMALNRGVGLENTRARLEHLYHSTYEFTFSNLERGFCVTVSIPFIATDTIREGAA